MVESLQSQGLNNPRVCMLGATGAGKSTFCNALSGKPGLFEESADGKSCTSVTRQEIVQWFGLTGEKNFFIVDTCGFGDSEERDETQLKQLTDSLRGFVYVNRFLVVLNSQQPRLDKQLQDMFKAFKVVFGDEVYKNFAVIYTRWAYDDKAIKERQKKKITEASRIQEINKFLKEKIGFDTDKFPVPCFFVDSSDFADLDKDDITMNSDLSNQFIKIKESCINTERFFCVSMGEYTSSETKLREEREKIETIRKEGEEALKKLEANKETREKIAQACKDEYAERYKRQIALQHQITSYFEGISLKQDIREILKKFNEKDTWRVSKQNFEEALTNELNSKILEKIQGRVQDMLNKEIQEFIDNYKNLIGELLDAQAFIKTLDIPRLGTGAFVTSVCLYIGGAGLLITGGLLAGSVLLAEGSALSLGGYALGAALLGPVALVAGGIFAVSAISISIFGWSREKIIDQVTKDAAEKIATKSTMKKIMSELAEKSLDIAANQITTAAYEEILRKYENFN